MTVILGAQLRTWGHASLAWTRNPYSLQG